MEIKELYPYWEGAHQDLLDVLELLTPAQLDAKPRTDVRSIRQIVMHLIHDERFLIGHLVAGYDYERPIPIDDDSVKELIEALVVTREITRRVLEPLTVAGMRAVRTLPADAATNRHETNVPINWLFWHVMQHEVYHWGQIVQRVEDTRQSNSRWD